MINEKRTVRHCSPILLLALTIQTITAHAQEGMPLRMVQTIPLPHVEGRIDHLAVDLHGQRLFVAALGNNTLEVLDLTAGTHLPYKPFQFGRGGKIVGFDVDMMDLVAKKLGVQQKIVNTPFEGIQSGQSLNVGKCDAAAAGMTITQERKRVLEHLQHLPDDGRDALIMRFALGMDNREIARALGRSDGATKVLIHRAIKQLEELMGAEHG